MVGSTGSVDGICKHWVFRWHAKVSTVREKLHVQRYQFQIAVAKQVT